MHIVYFITAHGFGHAVRSATIAANFSPSVSITFVTDIDSAFFRRELSRPYTLLPYRFDCGCLQSDFLTVDKKSTLELYRTIAAENENTIDEMAAWCRENAVDGIVSDIVPAAFEVAFRCTIPSLAVTNFTWFSIYREYLAEYPEFAPVLENMQVQYRKAGALIALSPAMPMNCFNRLEEVPVVARKGIDRKEEILSLFGSDVKKKVAAIYIGDFGMEHTDWSRLSDFSSWEFFGLQTISDAPDNYHRIDPAQLFYPDLVASADCIFGKLGYSLLAEAMSNGTPVVFPPRTGFAEHPFLERTIMEWGGGIRLPREAFTRFEWQQALNQVEQIIPLPVRSDGAETCAGLIEKYMASNRKQ